jgi:hypothetical protein
MKRVITYLAVLTAAAGYGLLLAASDGLPAVLAPYELLVQCALMGALGGLVYCLRGVYLSRSVRKDWSDDWITWYAIRPWVSLICGGVAFVFLEAGLLVLEADQASGSTVAGYLAFSFVAGLNVDGVLKRIEGVAEAAWGIDPSRAST